MYYSIFFKFLPSLQLYIYPGTSVVNYAQDESGLDIESRSRNSTEFDLDMHSNQQPENSTVDHAPEPDHHHRHETDIYLAPEKHSSPINHQETEEPHQITHNIHEHHPPHHINDQKPDYKPHQTKVVSQEKQDSEPNHTHSTHEIHEHHIPLEESKPDFKPKPTKIVPQEMNHVTGYHQEALDSHHNPKTHEIHEHHTPHHAVSAIGENDKNGE
jgi:hypothetical protein